MTNQSPICFQKDSCRCKDEELHFRLQIGRLRVWKNVGVGFRHPSGYVCHFGTSLDAWQVPDLGFTLAQLSDRESIYMEFETRREPQKVKHQTQTSRPLVWVILDTALWNCLLNGWWNLDVSLRGNAVWLACQHLVIETKIREPDSTSEHWWLT